MKKSLLVLTFFIFLAGITSLDAQVINVPKKSKEHFFKKYPDAKNADWNNNVANYAVKFQLSDTTARAYYHINGNWNFTEYYLEESQIPAIIKDSFKKSRFADLTIDSYAWVENRKGKKAYRIDLRTGVEKRSIFYDKDGKEVKSSWRL
jgi:hypothetical protein